METSFKQKLNKLEYQTNRHKKINMVTMHFIIVKKNLSKIPFKSIQKLFRYRMNHMHILTLLRFAYNIMLNGSRNQYYKNQINWVIINKQNK